MLYRDYVFNICVSTWNLLKWLQEREREKEVRNEVQLKIILALNA